MEQNKVYIVKVKRVDEGKKICQEISLCDYTTNMQCNLM